MTELGAAGSRRDHRTAMSPIFGKRSRPFPSTLKWALAVNRIACRLSPRDLNRGAEILGPDAHRRSWASRRARSASLKTTRAHPNALANMIR
ncbi:hypothetical protein ACQPZX_15870 [Actinoplanes sp. CA-142083]|uniref:hypothetical protein n=1 Tax=Actinoplanes sp. CA-142083 TaxID=3239903 RepID=UPI003D8B70CC